MARPPAPMTKIRSLLMLAALLWGLQSPAFGAVDVIVNNDVPLRQISENTLRAIYTLRQTRWPDGRPVQVFVLADDDPLHGEFAKGLLGMYPYQLRQIWDQMTFSGMGQAPVQLSSQTEMLRRVAATPGAIGYISIPAGNEHVHILSIR